MYDLTILGGGPAGVAAGVYAARKQLKTAFITAEWGGQSVVSEDIQNWIGFPHIAGIQFAETLKQHLLSYAGSFVEVKEGEYAQAIGHKNAGFVLKTDKSEYETKTVLITTGSHRRKLDIPGAAEFENKGITYCASCDGPLFADKDVAVIGGGNAGFETAAQLLAYCKSVTLLTHGPFRADPMTVQKVIANPKMKALEYATPMEIKGEKFVKAIVYQDDNTKQTVELPTEGIFVEIGLIPATEFVKGLVEMNKYNQIVTDPRTQKTSVPGIWAAGDSTDVLYHQNNIAAGDAVRALEDIYMHLHTK